MSMGQWAAEEQQARRAAEAGNPSIMPGLPGRRTAFIDVPLFSEASVRDALRMPAKPSKFEVAVDWQLKRIRDGLVAKNQAYGNSALEPVRIFSDADPLAQLNVRIDDKISRMKSGLPDDEDAAWDLLGYLVLREVAKRWKP